MTRTILLTSSSTHRFHVKSFVLTDYRTSTPMRRLKKSKRFILIIFFFFIFYCFYYFIIIIGWYVLMGFLQAWEEELQDRFETLRTRTLYNRNTYRPASHRQTDLHQSLLAIPVLTNIYTQ
jgi:hypothetical protein